ncbi:MAG TPA: thiol:disulfide interchange protein DsbA/DsbL [Burkholderiales bacterium]|jgi:thiol:disulfide interchange protein DsbA|nr:thiol:disulfide interchange protein DsbA/DsbL [Burkholderiales bacterium]
MNALLARLAWIFLLACACTVVRAQPVAGREYVVLDPPRQAQSGDKVEVLEFFYYGCPVCYEAQPHIARWQLDAGAGVTLKRVPAVSDAWMTFARVYYALEATGLLARLHWPVYDNHHFDGKRLNEDTRLLDWLSSNGVDSARFKQALDSHEVTIRVEEARKMLDTYKVNGVPSLVVDGKYVTSARLAGGVKEMMDVLEFLVARAREERGKK